MQPPQHFSQVPSSRARQAAAAGPPTGSVGAGVGSAVDAAVGSAVGAAVGLLEGSAVGAAVGLLEGSAVGAAVDSLVGSAVPAPHVEDRAGVLVVVGKVVGKGRAALLHAWT